MKNSGVLVVLSFTLCCFSGVNSNDKNGKSQVSCDKYMIREDFIVCPNVFSPVCGTNGKSYDNECFICQENLKSGQTVDMKYKRPCAEEKYCGTRVSATPVCTMEYNSHCGSNGKTYSNKCNFCKAVWESMEPLTLKHMGTCESSAQE